MLNQDNSTQAILFRLRKGDNPDQQSRALKSYCLQQYGKPEKPARGKVPTIIGERNGIPVGADQDVYQLQRNIMNHMTTKPFHSNRLSEIYPMIYNGNVNILAGTGGAPLAYALDDPLELEQRLYLEGIRASDRDPLSAKFAMKHRENKELPVQGGATDVMRREMEADEDDQDTMERKLKAGYLGDIRHQTADLREQTALDPEIQAYKDGKHPPTRADFNDMRTNFHATVQNIGGTTAAHLDNIRSQLESINTHSRNQSGRLAAIYDIASRHGNTPARKLYDPLKRDIHRMGEQRQRQRQQREEYERMRADILQGQQQQQQQQQQQAQQPNPFTGWNTDSKYPETYMKLMFYRRKHDQSMKKHDLKKMKSDRVKQQSEIFFDKRGRKRKQQIQQVRQREFNHKPSVPPTPIPPPELVRTPASKRKQRPGNLDLFSAGRRYKKHKDKSHANGQPFDVSEDHVHGPFSDNWVSTRSRKGKK
jgi:hypothetical protein